MKLNKAIESFLKEQKARGNTLKTIEDYRQNLSYFTDYAGDIEVSELDKQQILNYIVYLREKPKNLGHKNKEVKEDVFISSVTLQTYVRHLKAFLKWLYEEEIINIDLAAKVKLPKAKKELKKILTDEEIKAIFNVCLSLRDKLIISLMLYSGLRASEVICIEKNNYDSKNKLLTVFGKGQKERIVPVGKVTAEYLDSFLADENKYYYYRKQKYLFINVIGEPMTYNALRLMVSRVAKQSKVKRLHPHLLRHTFATRYLVKTKGDITSLKAILGHTSLKMVENYLHLATEYSIGQYREFCD